MKKIKFDNKKWMKYGLVLLCMCIVVVQVVKLDQWDEEWATAQIAKEKVAQIEAEKETMEAEGENEVQAGVQIQEKELLTDDFIEKSSLLKSEEDNQAKEEKESGIKVFGSAREIVRERPVLAGESLWSIAEDIYGDPYKWVYIYESNRKLLRNNPSSIHEGQYLVLPNDRTTIYSDLDYCYLNTIENISSWDGITEYIDPDCSYRIQNTLFYYTSPEGEGEQFMICYPKLISFNGKDVTRVNEGIRECAMMYADSMLINRSEEFENDLRTNEMFDINWVRSNVNYVITYLDEDTISVVFQDNLFEGSIYGENYDLRTYVADINTGIRYENEDLWKNLNDGKLAEIIQADLISQQDADSQDFFEETVTVELINNALQTNGYVERSFIDTFLTEDGVGFAMSYRVSQEKGDDYSFMRGRTKTILEREVIAPYRADCVFWERMDEAQNNRNYKEHKRISSQPSDTYSQIELICDKAAKYEYTASVFSDWSSDVYYTIDDLNQDGKLELILAAQEDGMLFTFYNMYEVNWKSTDLYSKQGVPYDYEGEKISKIAEYFIPDIITDTVEWTMNQETGEPEYYWKDILKVSSTKSYVAYFKVSLGDIWNCWDQLLGYYEYDSKKDSITYYDYQGKEISYDEFKECTEQEVEKNVKELNWKKYGDGIMLKDWSENTEEEIASEKIRQDVIKQYNIENKELEACLIEYVEVKEGTKIENISWLDDSGKCLRVSIQYNKQPEGLWYNHLEDYFFFVQEEKIDVLYVDYSSEVDMPREVGNNPDFNVHFEDVNLDGNKDLIIGLGMDEFMGGEKHCAYLYTEDGYKYCPSFEYLHNYKMDYDNQCLISTTYIETEDSDAEETVEYYFYRNGQFQILNEGVTIYELAERYLDMEICEISKETGCFLDEDTTTARIVYGGDCYPRLDAWEQGIEIYCEDRDDSKKPCYVSFCDEQATELFLGEFNLTKDMNFEDISNAIDNTQFTSAGREDVDLGTQEIYYGENINLLFFSKRKDGSDFKVYAFKDVD